jgi:rare lipoprotein A
VKTTSASIFRRPVLLAALALAVVLSAACSGMRYQTQPGGQVGIASWYGADFHGRTTSNREIYNMYDMTAAHPSLPFGTRVLVTNLDNGRTAEVRINDRGPFVKDRIIDLSYAAARMLGLVGPGTAPVRLDILENGEYRAETRYLIQVGSFVLERNARELRSRLGRRYGKAFISPRTISGRTYYRVLLQASDRAETRDLAARLSNDGFPVLVCEAY